MKSCIKAVLWALLCVAPITAAKSTAPAQPTSPSQSADALLQQRELFSQSRQQFRSGKIAAARQVMRQLQDYPLYPYLELADLRTRLRALPFAEVDDFLVRYPHSAVGDQLREVWLANLAFQNRWQEYLTYYQDQFGTAYRCWHIEALHHTGATRAALDQAERVWLTGRSLPDQCDPGIARWLNSSRDTQPLIWARLMLALDQGQTSLARYLASKLRGELQPQGQHALQLARDPRGLRTLFAAVSRKPNAGDVVVTTLKQLARRDTAHAEALWNRALAAKLLSPGQSSVVRREIGRQRIAADGAAALPWLLQRDPNGEDDYLLEWRIRLALRLGNWGDIAQWTTLLPEELGNSPRWQYWRARALLEQRDATSQRDGRALLAALSGARNYYGFLAADRLEQPYALNHQPMQPSLSLAEAARLPAVQRVRELYRLGERISASREWSRSFAALSEPQRQAATLLAQSWGWHIQAIRAAADAGGWNDLLVRFPLAYEEEIRAGAKAAAIPTEWLFAVARQESAFIPDARSHAGAVGLVQLLPGTARQVASKLGMRLNEAQLLDPAYSARLGAAYLQELMDRYQGNRILATAGYNAGPGRISRWLREHPEAVAADIWIESLPYLETRNYVQNVLTYAIIYATHLEQEPRLLAAHELSIGLELLQISRDEQTRR